MSQEQRIETAALLPQEPSAEQAKQPAAAGSIARYRWLADICCIVSLFSVAVFLFGVISAYDKDVSLLTVIEFLLDIASIRNGNVYQPLASAALGVIYIVIFVFIIRDLFRTIRYVGILFFRKLKGKKPQLPAFFAGYVCEYTSSILMKIFIFAILSVVFTEGALSAGSWAMLAIGCAYLLLYALCVCFPHAVRNDEGKMIRTRADWRKFALDMVRQTLIAALLCGLAGVLVTPVFTDLIFGVQVLFGGYFTGFAGFLQTFYTSVLQYVLNGIAILLFVALLSDALRSCNVVTGYRKDVNDSIKRKCHVILILMAVSAALACFITLFDTGGNVSFSTEMLRGWLRLLRVRLLPAILVSIMGLLIAYGLKEKAVRQDGTAEM